MKHEFDGFRTMKDFRELMQSIRAVVPRAAMSELNLQIRPASVTKDVLAGSLQETLSGGRTAVSTKV